MELRQLEHFVAVVEEQHFTRAARRCNLSQSALSASIRSLEREFGVALFVRTTRSVVVTDEGKVLLSKARSVLNAAASARDAVEDSRGRFGGSLRVGGVQTDKILDQASLLRRFHEEHPEVEIHYRSGPSVDLVDDVRTGALDVAFVSVPTKRPAGLDVKAITSLPMMFVCRVDHPLANLEVVPIDKLGDETFIGGPVRSVANDAIARVYRTAGKNRVPMAAVNDMHTMIDFVAKGLGVALLPQYCAAANPALKAIPLADPEMIWTVGAVALRQDSRTRAADAFFDMI